MSMGLSSNVSQEGRTPEGRLQLSRITCTESILASHLAEKVQENKEIH
jgi:hypothetical protein